MTLTFKLVRSSDQTRLPCEFGANPFSGFRDRLFHTQTKTPQTDGAKNGTFRSVLRAVTRILTINVSVPSLLIVATPLVRPSAFFTVSTLCTQMIIFIHHIDY